MSKACSNCWQSEHNSDKPMPLPVCWDCARNKDHPVLADNWKPRGKSGAVSHVLLNKEMRGRLEYDRH